MASNLSNDNPSENQRQQNIEPLSSDQILQRTLTKLLAAGQPILVNNPGVHSQGQEIHFDLTTPNEPQATFTELPVDQTEPKTTSEQHKEATGQIPPFPQGSQTATLTKRSEGGARGDDHEVVDDKLRTSAYSAQALELPAQGEDVRREDKYEKANDDIAASPHTSLYMSFPSPISPEKTISKSNKGKDRAFDNRPEAGLEPPSAERNPSNPVGQGDTEFEEEISNSNKGKGQSSNNQHEDFDAPTVFHENVDSLDTLPGSPKIENRVGLRHADVTAQAELESHNGRIDLVEHRSGSNARLDETLQRDMTPASRDTTAAGFSVLGSPAVHRSFLVQSPKLRLKGLFKIPTVYDTHNDAVRQLLADQDIQCLYFILLKGRCLRGTSKKRARARRHIDLFIYFSTRDEVAAATNKLHGRSLWGGSFYVAGVGDTKDPIPGLDINPSALAIGRSYSTFFLLILRGWFDYGRGAPTEARFKELLAAENINYCHVELRIPIGDNDGEPHIRFLECAVHLRADEVKSAIGRLQYKQFLGATLTLRLETSTACIATRLPAPNGPPRPSSAPPNDSKRQRTPDSPTGSSKSDFPSYPPLYRLLRITWTPDFSQSPSTAITEASFQELLKAYFIYPRRGILKLFTEPNNCLSCYGEIPTEEVNWAHTKLEDKNCWGGKLNVNLVFEDELLSKEEGIR